MLVTQTKSKQGDPDSAAHGEDKTWQDLYYI